MLPVWIETYIVACGKPVPCLTEKADEKEADNSNFDKSSSVSISSTRWDLFVQLAWCLPKDNIQMLRTSDFAEA